MHMPVVLPPVEAPVVVVLVGAAGSGKTTLRRSLAGRGYVEGTVVSLDELRRLERAQDLRSGRNPRPLQDYSARAVRRAGRRCDALAGFRAGYLADATHLRRSERVPHVRVAESAGLDIVAVLLPAYDLETLLAIDAGRPSGERVPRDVLARHAHRRSLLDAALLRGEGFSQVYEMPSVPRDGR